MTTGKAILITLGLFILMVLITAITDSTGGMGLIIIGSSIWAAFDASKIEAKKYKIFLGGPVQTFFGCLLLWIVAFPLYLHTKGKIERGGAELKEKYRQQEDSTTN